jgi:hypothetical protein
MGSDFMKIKLRQYVKNYKDKSRFVSVDVKLTNWVDNIDKAQAYLDATVVKDTQKYVPIDTGNLRGTGIEQSIYGAGYIQYGDENTPYASYQYYGDDFNHQVGYARWFEVAKMNHGDKWINDTKKIAGGN